jgi:hypothetical protein
MFSHVKGRTHAMLFLKNDLAANIWAKRNENGEWRRHHNENLFILHRSPNIARVMECRLMRWAGYLARREDGRSALKMFTGKLTTWIPPLRCKLRWEDNIRMDLNEIGYNTRNWFDSPQVEETL